MSLSSEETPSESPEPAVRALIVDNDRAHAEVVAESLEPVGFDCQVASSGSEAVQQIEQRPFDVVVTDLVMNDLDGPAQNWWRELGGPGFLDRGVDQLLVALIEIYGLDPCEAVHIEIFPSDHQHFEWIPDPDHPSSGELEPLD